VDLIVTAVNTSAMTWMSSAEKIVLSSSSMASRKLPPGARLASGVNAHLTYGAASPERSQIGPVRSAPRTMGMGCMVSGRPAREACVSNGQVHSTRQLGKLAGPTLGLPWRCPFSEAGAGVPLAEIVGAEH
jgi:hypothetical protein